jgi:catechol 2,3-dioxygenase-like lactoylglutathione lyase family enzyme
MRLQDADLGEVGREQEVGSGKAIGRLAETLPLCPSAQGLVNLMELGWGSPFPDSGHPTRRENAMLADHRATATIAVKNLTQSRRFYEDVLGFRPVHEEGSEAVSYESGGAQLLVYHSEYAGTNRATSATWTVSGGLETLVASLREKGVSFEHYDLPHATLRGDVHVIDGMKAAWFKDPDGNILALVGN